MADIKKLELALQNASTAADAGDAQAASDARELANEIKRLRVTMEAANQPKPRTPEEEEAELQRLVPGVSTNPTDGMGGGQKFWAGVGSSLAQTGRGIGQLVGAVSQEEADQAAQDEAALLDTGAGISGNVLGHVSQLLVPAGYAVKAGTAAPRLANAGRVVLNPRSVTAANGAKGTAAGVATAAAIGAGQAGLQPVTSDETRAGNMARGAAFGAGGQAVGEVIGATARPVIRALGRGRQAEATAGDVLRAEASPQAIAALQAGRVGGDIIPGSPRTTAELTRDRGLAALERTVRSKPEFAGEFADLDAARNAARVGLVRGQFRGASDDAAETIRSQVADAQGPVINEAKKAVGAETMRVINGLDRLLKSPRFVNSPPVADKLKTVRGLLAQPIDDAGRLSAARQIAVDATQNTGRMSTADFDKVREAARLVRGASQRGESSAEVLAQVKKIKPGSSKAQTHIANMMRALRTAEKGKPDVASLYNARKYVTNTLMKGADSEQMVALRSVIGKLDDEIGAVAPTYKQYLRDYTAGMREADQAAVGAALLRTGASRPSEAAGAVQLGEMTKRAAGDLDAVTRRATGFPRATADKTLTPAQIKAAKAVAEDIDSQGFVMSQSRALKGQSITGEVTSGQNRLAQIATGVAANSVPGGNVGLMAADAILAQIGKRQGARVQAIVTEALRNPTRAQQILSTLPVDVRQDVVRMLGPLGQTRGLTLGAIGAGSGQAAATDIGTVSGYDRNDPRYRGD